MALPKQRHTTHRRDRARKQYDVDFVNIHTCPKCKGPIMPHKACPKCGTYKGRDVIKIKSPALKSQAAPARNASRSDSGRSKTKSAG